MAASVRRQKDYRLASLESARKNHTAVVLEQGRVLLISGAAQVVLDSAELYQP